MFNRRSFLSYTGGTTLMLFAYSKFGVKEAIAAIPGRTLDPTTTAFQALKFTTPMLIPPVMPRAGKIKIKMKGKDADYHEISMKQFAQQILPAGLPSTTVWGRGGVISKSKNGLLLHNAP